MMSVVRKNIVIVDGKVKYMCIKSAIDKNILHFNCNLLLLVQCIGSTILVHSVFEHARMLLPS